MTSKTHVLPSACLRTAPGEDTSFDSHCYAHYLHHKYFECNDADGTSPLDMWFGSLHDGSDGTQTAMDERFMDCHAKP